MKVPILSKRFNFNNVKLKDTNIYKMRISFLTLIIALVFQNLSAQERLSGLVANPAVKNASVNYQSNRQLLQRIQLPFFDDFSNTGSVFPSQSHWTDNYVYINNDYPVNSPTIGVATFDAIDNFGHLYSHASPFPFTADTLTSVEIRLDSVFAVNNRIMTRGDSLYFSFFYQPQGFGNAPAQHDSLILEFLAPDEDLVIIIPADTVITGTDTLYYPADTTVYENWIRVWSSSGSSLESFYSQDSLWFRQVMVPISDSVRFYKPDFRFRFINIATLADAILPDWQSNGDQWNIDYVYLNLDRSVLDMSHPDVAFAAKAPNMLSRYTSMPYNQYRKKFVTEMAGDLDIFITNLDDDSYNASYRYEVLDDNGTFVHAYSGGNYFVAPYATSGYVTEPAFANPPVEFQFPISNPEPVSFTTVHILNTEANLGFRRNDTIRQTQIFSNYLSYDDGTAEAGYGVTPTGAQVAYKFQLNSNDSLFGVNMFFNETLSQGNVNEFYLNVWNDYFGQPGEIIYSKFGYKPVITDSLNKFFYYPLDSPIMIEPGSFPNLIFYVGWEQASDNVLNIGYDRNSDAAQHIFWRTFNNWNNSLYKGALMLRPIIGKEKVLTIDETPVASRFSLYPNPVSDDMIKLNTDIAPSEFSKYTLMLTSSDGRTVKQVPFSQILDLKGIPAGFYIVRIMYQNRVVGAEKLINNR